MRNDRSTHPSGFLATKICSAHPEGFPESGERQGGIRGGGAPPPLTTPSLPVNQYNPGRSLTPRPCRYFPHLSAYLTNPKKLDLAGLESVRKPFVYPKRVLG